MVGVVTKEEGEEKTEQEAVGPLRQAWARFRFAPEQQEVVLLCMVSCRGQQYKQSGEFEEDLIG